MREMRHLPLVSGTLSVINIIVFLVCTFTGNLLYNIGVDKRNALQSNYHAYGGENETCNWRKHT